MLFADNYPVVFEVLLPFYHPTSLIGPKCSPNSLQSSLGCRRSCRTAGFVKSKTPLLVAWQLSALPFVFQPVEAFLLLHASLLLLLLLLLILLLLLLPLLLLQDPKSGRQCRPLVSTVDMCHMCPAQLGALEDYCMLWLLHCLSSLPKAHL